MSKFFIGLGLTIWSSIVVLGYFLVKAFWDLDIKAYPMHGVVILLLGLLWVVWLFIGGIFGLAALVEGLNE